MKTNKKLENDVFTYYYALFQTFMIKWNHNLHVIYICQDLLYFQCWLITRFPRTFCLNIIIIGSFLILFFVLISTLTYIFFFSIFWKFESRSIILSAVGKKLNIQYVLNFGVIYDFVKFYKISNNSSNLK
jgi:hypothetical protein